MSQILILFTSMFSIWVVAAWIACAGFAAHVAAEKNRCRVCWFIWGALFNIFALIAVAGLPDNQGIRVSDHQTDAQITRSKAAVSYGYEIGKNFKKPNGWIALGIVLAGLAYAYYR